MSDLENGDSNDFHSQFQSAELLTRTKVTPGVCGRCCGQVNPLAFVCNHCQFELSKHNDNLRLAKMTRMTQCTRDHQGVWMRKHYKTTSSYLWMLLIVAGVLALFIPFLGWFISPLIFLCAFVTLVAPARGTMLLEFITNHQEYKANLLKAQRASANTYTDVFCPLCGHSFASAKKKTVYGWSNGEDYSLPCLGCGKVLYRVSHSILWLPHPSVTLSGKLDEYLPPQ
jgi:multisubunit Na+/H+ antiporter MnhG subunit